MSGDHRLRPPVKLPHANGSPDPHGQEMDMVLGIGPGHDGVEAPDTAVEQGAPDARGGGRGLGAHAAGAGSHASGCDVPVTGPGGRAGSLGVPVAGAGGLAGGLGVPLAVAESRGQLRQAAGRSRMALQATEQGSHPVAAADLGNPRQPTVDAPPSFPTGGGAVVGCDKRIAAAGFPDDILLEILSRLPVKSLFRFKCVSKAWLGLVTDCLRKAPPRLQGLFYGPKRETFGRFFNLLGASLPPIDPSFSFLPKLTDTKVSLMDSCNGLVLFDIVQPRPSCTVYRFNSMPGYIVCNPATKEWVGVPSSNKDFLSFDQKTIISTHIVFDPAVSPQFELVQFLLQNGKNRGRNSNRAMDVLQIHAYSSESRAWSQRATECWSHDESINPGIESTLFNGMIHLSVSVRLHSDEYENVIVAVDGRGEKRRVIRWPEEERGLLEFLGQSQGLLHCMSAHYWVPGDYMSATKVSIWVLEDYDKEQWVLKDTVTCMQLFGEVSCLACPVTIYPDRSLALFFNLKNRKLVSYDMDSKEVSALCTLDCWFYMTPYVPYFVESSALAKKC